VARRPQSRTRVGAAKRCSAAVAASATAASGPTLSCCARWRAPTGREGGVGEEGIGPERQQLRRGAVGNGAADAHLRAVQRGSWGKWETWGRAARSARCADVHARAGGWASALGRRGERAARAAALGARLGERTHAVQARRASRGLGRAGARCAGPREGLRGASRARWAKAGLRRAAGPRGRRARGR
jgi:hypothetical protein